MQPVIWSTCVCEYLEREKGVAAAVQSSSVIMADFNSEEVMNFAKQKLEIGAKQTQDKAGGPENASVVTAQIVVPAKIGKESQEVSNGVLHNDGCILLLWVIISGCRVDRIGCFVVLHTH